MLSLIHIYKVRAYVFFRGRSILFKEQGEVLLLRFANDLEEYGKVEMCIRDRPSRLQRERTRWALQVRASALLIQTR